MRGRLLNFAAIGRALGFALVAVAIVATVVHFRHGDTPSRTSDPLAHELARCQAIGMAAKDDATCEAAWAENRRHFLTYRRPSDRSMTPPAVNPSDAAPKLEGK